MASSKKTLKFTQTEAASTGDRFSFTLFLAIALHGLAIFGIVFELSQPGESAPSVAVTLATHKSETAPENADFVAQSNQIGSGTLEEAKQITSDQLSPFNSEVIEQTQLFKETKTTDLLDAKNQTITTTDSKRAISNKPTELESSEKKDGQDSRDIHTPTQEIASLHAKLDKQKQQYAKRPRERVLTSVSTKSANDATYLEAWARKVETVGNENFPKEAIQQKITGKLRLQSIIKWDGSLIKAEILESSGHRILDDAALQIIRRSAPFMSFPPEIRKNTDQLVIIRTWYFKIDGLLTSQ